MENDASLELLMNPRKASETGSDYGFPQSPRPAAPRQAPFRVMGSRNGSEGGSVEGGPPPRRRFGGGGGGGGGGAGGGGGQRRGGEDGGEDEDGEGSEGAGSEGAATEEASEGGSEEDDGSSVEEVPRHRSRAEVENAKRDILYKMDRLERRGVKMPRRHDMTSDLREMEEDLARVRHDKESEAAVRFQKRALMAMVTGVEYLNKHFDPFDVYLDGWSETMNESLEEYDEVMEELADKYKGKGRMAPELQMLLMVASSAFMFHLSNSVVRNMAPDATRVMRDNPELMRQFAQASAQSMAPGDATGFAGMMAGMGSRGGGGPPPGPHAPPQQQQQQQQQQMQQQQQQPQQQQQQQNAPIRPPGNLGQGSRADEVLQFIKSQQDREVTLGGGLGGLGGVPAAAIRPPLPQLSRSPAEGSKSVQLPAPAMQDGARPTNSFGLQSANDTSDVFEVMSSASEAASEVTGSATSGGGARNRAAGRRRRNTMVID